MKCDNCGHLRNDGYEYSEYYCELGVGSNTDYDKYETIDGCRLTKKQRKKICQYLTHNWHVALWWDESEEV